MTEGPRPAEGYIGMFLLSCHVWCEGGKIVRAEPTKECRDSLIVTYEVRGDEESFTISAPNHCSAPLSNLASPDCVHSASAPLLTKSDFAITASAVC